MIKNYKFLTKVAMLLLTFLIPLAGWGQTYELTTSLSAGDEVVLVNTSVTKELGPLSTTATVYGTAVDVENSTPVGSNLLTVAAGSAEGSFAFKTSDDKYLSWSSGNSLTTADDVTDASSWTITFDDEGNATVTNVGTTARILSYNSGSPRFACYGNMNQQRVRFYKKESAASDAPSITADNVNIAYDAEEGVIAYTIENEVEGGSVNATTTADWLTLGENFESPIAFTCSANEGGERTATVTLTYSYGDSESVTKNVTVTQAGNPNAPGTENNPYTVAEALANTPASGTSANVYVRGIVSRFQKDGGGIMDDGNNFRYYISDDGTTTSEIQVYRGKGLNNVAFSNNNDLLVGDEVVICGGLTTYNTTKEIAANNYIVSLNRPVSEDPAVTLENYNISVAAERSEDILTVQYQNIDNIEADIQFYDENGEEVDANYYEVWLTASLDDDNNVNYIAIENYGEERKAYFKVFALVGDDFVYSDMITITQAAYVPKWIVSFDTDGGTFVPNDDFAEEIVEVEQGTHYLPSATKDGYRLDGWNDGDATYAAGCGYDVTGDVEFTAVWVEKGVEEWVKTDISELEEGDVFVIVGNNGSDYAMTNDNGASAPLPVAVTVEDDKITSEVAENIQWNIANGTNGYIFYPNGSTTTFLYCIDNNNGLRVGAGSGTYSNTFELDESGYLKTNVNNKDRFVGIYTASNASAPQDWRCYTNTTGNIANQTFAFYKKVETYPASTVTITINEGYAATTFSCDKALDFSNLEITAFIITDENGTTAEVTKVPANTGIYVEGAEGSYEVPILVLADESEADDVTGNKLIPTVAGETLVSNDEFTYYAYGKQKGTEAFFKISTDTAKGLNQPANKAVLAIEAAAGAKDVIFVNGDVTGIDSIDNEQPTNSRYFTVDGKLVKGQPTQKGIYIVNGRKVVIK